MNSGTKTSENAVAVVGTDTGVGKTVVTAGLVGWLREEGYDARAIKPAQTGYPPDDDAAFVADACGTERAATCCRRLEPALAPAVAATVADEPLSYDSLLEDVAAELDAANPGVVEGIGGLRVPLADGRDVLDLVADLGVPAVVVARSGLGTLNHTALSVSALRRRGVDVTGIVLNQYDGESLAERTNPDALAEMVDCPIHTLPSFSVAEPSDAVSAVSAALPRSIFDDILPAERV
ncbi:dethiobiotin synthase [Natrialba aegyptia]|uniref:ATP-dependent dethiobiotin synthetase BioD n=1 Tax=Natrialba aegyptia DSM 13077 TaxID=1227491 RepID=M0BLG5_9EURY|nr:dethiobiotin synthase [Natrialba aegyptia]ELZ10454.1 dethiobiotin synthase [Natrialba aegyptia DSM 13077]